MYRQTRSRVYMRLTFSVLGKVAEKVFFILQYGEFCHTRGQALRVRLTGIHRLPGRQSEYQG